MSRHSPFASVVPSVVVAVGYALATLTWVIAGPALPGGRWLAVHLFTLGVLTNVVLAFSEHFGRTLTHAKAASIRWQTPAVNVGILLVLAGMPSGARWATTVGFTVVTGVVTVSYVRLRRMRTQAIGARFGWIVRTYERAHGAFIHGVVLGVLMGTGVLTGSWYGPARTAHLHINLLGWGGLTLLATLVFFGPTMARTRILDGADDRAAKALRYGAGGLTVSVLLLLATGFGPAVAPLLRVAAAGAMAVYAWATSVVCLAVARAVRAAKPSAPRESIVAACLWFPVVVWADVVVIATGTWRWLDAVGLALILGVLAQTIASALTYLAPMLRGRDADGRERLRVRLATGARTRTAIYNAGAAAVIASALLRDAFGGTLGRAGWTLIVLGLTWPLASAATTRAGERATNP